MGALEFISNSLVTQSPSWDPDRIFILPVSNCPSCEEVVQQLRPWQMVTFKQAGQAEFGSVSVVILISLIKW